MRGRRGERLIYNSIYIYVIISSDRELDISRLINFRVAKLCNKETSKEFYYYKTVYSTVICETL